jgi:hypothetical protein
MSSLAEEDGFGPVGAPQLTASRLGLSELLAVIGFVEPRVQLAALHGRLQSLAAVRKGPGLGLMLMMAEHCILYAAPIR